MHYDKTISNIVQYYLPEFYRAEAPNFIAFVKAYYEWMEQEGYTINASRQLHEYRDIDTTIDQFVASFKNQYLQKFPGTTAVDPSLLVKKVKDFYISKGSPQGLDLLFRLLYGADIQVYDPGQDILKASDGVWKVPTYIEVDHGPRSREMVGSEITGSKSGATAFVESIHTTIINNRLIDIMNLSAVAGTFEYGELVTNDGDFFNAPKITGSLTYINVVDGGANNKVGDLFQITTAVSGKYGSARVVATVDGTGKVTFTLVDGGSGYTNSQSQIFISNAVLFTSNVTNSNTSVGDVFYPFEQVRQNLDSIKIEVLGTTAGPGTITANSSTRTVTGTSTTFTTNMVPGSYVYKTPGGSALIGVVASVANNTSLTLVSNAAANVVTNAYTYGVLFPNTTNMIGQTVIGYVTSNGFQASNGTVVGAPNANTIIINGLSGNLAAADVLATTSNVVYITGYTVNSVSATGVLTGSNTTAIGLHNTSNQFYLSGQIYGLDSNTYASVSSIGTGNNASFQIGGLIDTENVFLFTDLLSGNNDNFVPFMDLIISGSNSNTGLLLGTGSITVNTATNQVTGSTSNFTGEAVVGGGLYLSTGNVFLGTVNSITNTTSLQLTSNSLANGVTAGYYYNVGQLGFPKDPSITYTGLMVDALNFGSYTIGTIGSLSAISPGQNYNAAPFVTVYNAFVAAYNRRNIILNLINAQGPFVVGDTVTQTVTIPTATIGINSNTGAFSNGEGITQSNGTSNAYGTITSANSTFLILNDVSGTFRANSAGGQNILGLTSGATANAANVSSSSTTDFALGIITHAPNNSLIEIKRTSFNTSFIAGTPITSSLGGNATILAVSQNVDSRPMGWNAVITDRVSTAKGIATTLEVMNSGYGHQPNDYITLTSSNNEFAITGYANVSQQGKGDGFWLNNRGKLNSDKYIHDNNYYQEYSYEIRSSLSLDTYANILKNLAHVLGTKMFGKVTLGVESRQVMNMVPSQLVIKQNGTELVDQ